MTMICCPGQDDDLESFKEGLVAISYSCKISFRYMISELREDSTSHVRSPVT